MRLSLKYLAPGAVALVASLALASAAAAQPAFSKAFSPSTIGPGSASELVFTITNNSATPLTDLAFTDTLPAGVTIATPSGAATDCFGATLSAPAGGGTITFSDGELGASASCTVTVFVTSSTSGTHMNVSGDLTSSAGNSGTANADLTVDAARPGISKSFAPSTIPLDGFSTLTFMINNMANPGAESFFVADEFPAGVTVASPVVTTNTCVGGFTSPPSAGDDGFFFTGSVGSNTTCSFSVEVTGAIPGTALNRTQDATFGAGGDIGIAIAVLEVEPPGFLVKRFTDDPAVPGGTVTLEFTLTNRDRVNAATGITFTDDLDATLTGLSAIALPTDPCGAGSTLTGTTTLTLSGGILPPEGSCTFSATLQVPGGAAGGVYVNTTSQVEVDYGAGPVFEDPASDRLVVSNAPLLRMVYNPTPGVAGDNAQVLRFTLDNASAQAASEVIFSDDLGGLPIDITTLPGINFCGSGSFATLDLGTVSFVNLSLAPGATCSFDVGYDLPLGAAPGDYPNVTSLVNATVGGESTAGPPASDTLSILAAPRLTKEFVGDPAPPGGLVDLVFTLTLDANAAAGATDVAFTDDLDAALSGLTAVGTPVAGCGGTLTGTSDLSFSGGSLAPDDTCSFSVQVLVPLTAPPGSFTNTTSTVSATMSGTPVASPAASDDLEVSGLSLSKEFIGDPVVPGGNVILRFTIANDSLTATATDLSFSDQVNSSLAGLAATSTPQSNVCGAGSSISGTTTLLFSNGSLGPASSCTFDVTLAVPSAAAPGFYSNFTSQLSGQFDGSPVSVPGGADELQVVGAFEIGKQFLDDPVAPGDTVTLRFTLTNNAPADAASSVAFSDDLDASLPGLAAVGLPMAGCGGTISGTTDLTFSGGTVAAASSCFFDVTVQVPVTAPFGSYPNTTSAVTGTIGGVGFTGNQASDTLTVSVGPAIEKSFSTSPVRVGETAELEFTITNTSPTLPATDVAFSDDLEAFLPGVLATLPADGSCGVGSTFTLTGTQTLNMSGGTLAPGASCVFTVGLQLPAAGPPGTFTNTSGAVSATIGGTPQVGNATNADLTTVAPPLLTKTFLDNPVSPGGTSTLEFTVDNPNPGVALNSIAFSDDLDAALAGLASVSPLQNDVCGAGSQLSGGSVLSFTGGTLAGGASCTFSVTSAPTANGGGLALTGAAAGDELRISSFTFEKAFSGTAMPGGTVVLVFTLTNVDPLNPATGLGFSDDLDAVLPGLVAIDTPLTDPCGAGSALTGTSLLTLTGGQLAAGSACSFAVTLELPDDDTLFGTFVNTTSELTSGGVPVAAPAQAELEVLAGVGIPALDGWGLLALVALLAAAAWWRLRRSPSLSGS